MTLNDGTDLAQIWLAKLKRHPVVAVGIFAATILGGVLGLVKDTGNLWDWVVGRLEKPHIVALGLSPSAIGFEETRERIFGASEESVLTFQPHYPFADEPRAILLVTVSNPNREDAIITSVTYVVEEASSVMGGPSGPLDPLASYHHKIEHKKGEQAKALSPPFRVAAESSASLDLELSSATPGYGLGWLLRLRFESTLGDFTTEHFLLYLPKAGSVKSKDRVSAPKSQPLPRTSGILMTRIEVGIPMPTYRDCIFKKAGVYTDLERLDHLDRDMLFMRAGRHSVEEFATHNTETDPPVPYGKLLTQRKIELLLGLIKSKAECSAGG